jgi:hypothetical protein
MAMDLIVNKEYLSANGKIYPWRGNEVQIKWGNTRVTGLKDQYNGKIAVSIEDIFDPRYPKTLQVMRFELNQTIESDLSKVDLRGIAPFEIISNPKT